jgi:hypothetical protein
VLSINEPARKLRIHNRVNICIYRFAFHALLIFILLLFITYRSPTTTITIPNNPCIAIKRDNLPETKDEYAKVSIRGNDKTSSIYASVDTKS